LFVTTVFQPAVSESTASTRLRVGGATVRKAKLPDAVRKMTLLPAQRLERVVPAMRAKGRIQVGSDADLTVFDPARVIDRATYERPAQFSDGIVVVLTIWRAIFVKGVMLETTSTIWNRACLLLSIPFCPVIRIIGIAPRSA